MSSGYDYQAERDEQLWRDYERWCDEHPGDLDDDERAERLFKDGVYA